jgi:hypothetical protein
MKFASALVLVAVLVAAAGGCGGSDGPPCMVMLPTECPTPAPSYATNVAPIFQATCNDCHSPGKQTGTIPFNNYVQVYARRTTILDQIYRCKMPPADGPPTTPEQVKTLMDWLICKAPNN